MQLTLQWNVQRHCNEVICDVICNGFVFHNLPILTISMIVTRAGWGPEAGETMILFTITYKADKQKAQLLFERLST